MGFTKILAMTLLAAGLAVTPVLAKTTTKPFSPVGSWLFDTGEARIQVEYCGDNYRICLKLVWLRKDVRTPDLLPYLGKDVLVGADRALTNKWRGDAVFDGQQVRGTVTIVDDDTLTLNGCKGPLCRKFHLHRVR